LKLWDAFKTIESLFSMVFFVVISSAKIFQITGFVFAKGNIKIIVIKPDPGVDPVKEPGLGF